MRKILFWLCCFVFFTTASSAQSATVAGITVDVFLSGRTNSRTVIYVPGCNGKDAIGRLYQPAHLAKLQQLFNNDVNVLIPQVFDDVTKGAKDGVCYLDTAKQNEIGTNSLVLARKVAEILPWIKEQPWFNGTAHYFGFSQGGRVGIFSNSLTKTKGFFKTYNLIWPMCLAEYAPTTLLDAHTATRIYATESDPISQPKNCPSYYTPQSPIYLRLFPGDAHSWVTHPSIPAHTDYWPNYKKFVFHRYVREYADEMWD